MTWGKGKDFETVKTFTCSGCGKQITATANQAHQDHGWDVPPYFTITTCSTKCFIKMKGNKP